MLLQNGGFVQIKLRDTLAYGKGRGQFLCALRDFGPDLNLYQPDAAQRCYQEFAFRFRPPRSEPTINPEKPRRVSVVLVKNGLASYFYQNRNSTSFYGLQPDRLKSFNEKFGLPILHYSHP